MALARPKSGVEEMIETNIEGVGSYDRTIRSMVDGCALVC